MNETQDINERVDVVSIGYAKESERKKYVPAVMRYHHREIKLEFLMRHPTSQGHRMVHIFDATDGDNDYRLAFDTERLTWTLQSILPGGNDGQV